MMDFHKGRWRLALGRLVNLRYINRWIIFSATFSSRFPYRCWAY